MKQLLSWSVLLLLVACTLPLTAAAADEKCEGILTQGSNGHKAITASSDGAVDVMLKKADKIEVYLNLDDDSPTICANKDIGTISLGQCKIIYKLNGNKIEVKVTVNGQGGEDVQFDYDGDAPHQAKMLFSSQGIEIRGPSEAGKLITNTKDCLKLDSNQLMLAKATDDCRLQLEFKEDVIDNVKSESCENVPIPPIPTDAPTSTDQSGPTVTNKPGPVPSDKTSSIDPSATTPVQPLPSGEPTPSGPVTAAPTTTAADNSLVIIIVCSVVGVLLLLIIVGIVVYCCIIKKKKKDNEEDAEAAEPKDQDAEAEADGAQKSEKKEPDAAAAADGPEAENTQRDSEKKASDQTQSEGADNTQNE